MEVVWLSIFSQPIFGQLHILEHLWRLLMLKANMFDGNYDGEHRFFGLFKSHVLDGSKPMFGCRVSRSWRPLLSGFGTEMAWRMARRPRSAVFLKDFDRVKMTIGILRIGILRDVFEVSWDIITDFEMFLFHVAALFWDLTCDVAGFSRQPRSLAEVPWRRQIGSPIRSDR